MRLLYLLVFFFLSYTFTLFAQDTSLAVMSNGNVGIGTSTPGAKLEVNSGSSSISTRFTTTSVFSGVTFQNSSVNAGDVIVGAQGSDLRLVTNGTDRIAIKNDGRVGIGTLNPTSELGVNGTITISGANTNELNRSQTGDANIVPIAYGTIGSDGTIYSGSTENFTLTKIGTGWYEVDIGGFYYQNYVVNCSVYGSNLYFITYYDIGSVLRFKTYNSSGTETDRPFNFVIYKK